MQNISSSRVNKSPKDVVYFVDFLLWILQDALREELMVMRWNPIDLDKKYQKRNSAHSQDFWYQQKTKKVGRKGIF